MRPRQRLSAISSSSEVFQPWTGVRSRTALALRPPAALVRFEVAATLTGEGPPAAWGLRISILDLGCRRSITDPLAELDLLRKANHPSLTGLCGRRAHPRNGEARGYTQTDMAVFGIIKSVLGLRQFSLRGLDKVRGEWSLVTMAWNLKRMFALTPA